MTRPGSGSGPGGGRHAAPPAGRHGDAGDPPDGGHGRHAATDESGRAAIERALRERPPGGRRRAREEAPESVTESDDTPRSWHGVGPGALVLPANGSPVEPANGHRVNGTHRPTLEDWRERRTPANGHAAATNGAAPPADDWQVERPAPPNGALPPAVEDWRAERRTSAHGHAPGANGAAAPADDWEVERPAPPNGALPPAVEDWRAEWRASANGHSAPHAVPVDDRQVERPVNGYGTGADIHRPIPPAGGPGHAPVDDWRADRPAPAAGGGYRGAPDEWVTERPGSANGHGRPVAGDPPVAEWPGSANGHGRPVAGDPPVAERPGAVNGHGRPVVGDPSVAGPARPVAWPVIPLEGPRGGRWATPPTAPPTANPALTPPPIPTPMPTDATPGRTRRGSTPLPPPAGGGWRATDRPAPGPPSTGERVVHVFDGDSTQQLRRYVPAQEMLDREPATRRPPTLPKHPPRAVVRRRRTRRRVLEWPFLIVFALLSAYLIRAYVVQTFFIPSGSMHETLIEGDRVLVNKVSYHLHDVDRGDVVVFRRPPDFRVEDEDLIKRVVALPGERVEARGRQVYVNGQPLTEPYVEPTCRGTQDFAPVTVPDGQLWVMGDNRCNSSDSRVFGPISQELLVGRAFVLAFPFDRLSWL